MLCRKAGIEIAGWGNDALVVYAASPDRAQQIAVLLGPLGLKVITDEGDAEAGLLTLSRNQGRTT